MSEKFSKNTRTLDMYERLCEGKIINKAEEAAKFCVDARSIQRDIDDIRAFLAEKTAFNANETRTIEYSRAKGGFVMCGNEDSIMDNSEILAVSKILLESRAFTKDEINSILNKLLIGCVPKTNMKLVSELIANEKFHYVELHNQSHIKDKLWQLGSEIKACNVLEIQYLRQSDKSDTVTRYIQPVALLFSEYYFYLNAYIVEQNEEGEFEQRYDYPAVFRVDRIKSFKKAGCKFTIPYSDRFDEGEFRKRVQFMYPGNLINLEFKYTGKSVEAVLDRLPTAKVIKQDETGYIINAEVYGKGIMMWLLSQGTMVEVLKPLEFRGEMKNTISNIMQLYT